MVYHSSFCISASSNEIHNQTNNSKRAHKLGIKSYISRIHEPLKLFKPVLDLYVRNFSAFSVHQEDGHQPCKEGSYHPWVLQEEVDM